MYKFKIRHLRENNKIDRETTKMKGMNSTKQRSLRSEDSEALYFLTCASVSCPDLEFEENFVFMEDSMSYAFWKYERMHKTPDDIYDCLLWYIMDYENEFNSWCIERAREFRQSPARMMDIAF